MGNRDDLEFIFYLSDPSKQKGCKAHDRFYMTKRRFNGMFPLPVDRLSFV
jgi:hypothetical protein